MNDERLDVQLVIAVGDLGDEEHFVVVALGAAMMVSHASKPTMLALACLLSVGRCKCNADAEADAAVWLEAGADVNVPRSAELEELWTRAKDGEDDELARLAAREGEHGLEERAAMPQHRVTALRAMAFADGFSALPTLGAAAMHGTSEEASAAVESADTIAARKRTQGDVEDRDELSAGCTALLGAARDAVRPRPVRVGAVRALRMLADAYGTHCVKPVDIPTDVDAR